MYALVDCNTFYASCELIFRADLWGKPVVVLSNNDGCIISRNAEAKALGIPGMLPFFQVKDQIRKHRVHIFSSNYELYGDISSRVMADMSGVSDQLEVYSIDEAFLKLTGGDFVRQGQSIKTQLWRHITMPVCVGIGPTKTLAKLANRAAKNIPSLNGVCVLDTKDKRDWLLHRVQTADIWGVGSRIGERLSQLGILNGYELAKADPKTLRRHFGVTLERTIRELNGEPCLAMALAPKAKQEIICTRSFSYKIKTLHELQQAISLYAMRACEKMRNQNGYTETVWVYLESFDKKVGHYNKHKILALPFLTNDSRLISKVATEGIKDIYMQGIRYKKCGIGLREIRPRSHEQHNLFEEGQTDQSSQIMDVLDKINLRYGKQSMTLAATGIQPKWTMQRRYLSPAYTTRWKDLPRVRC